MRASLFCSVMIASLFSYSATANAEGFNGFCLDNIEAGCNDRLLPFYKGGFTLDFCEETCTLVNPVNVRDLEAILYDFDCASDNGVIPNQRIMILKQKSYDGRVETLFIDKHETREIVRC